MTSNTLAFLGHPNVVQTRAVFDLPDVEQLHIGMAKGGEGRAPSESVK